MGALRELRCTGNDRSFSDKLLLRPHLPQSRTLRPHNTCPKPSVMACWLPQYIFSCSISFLSSLRPLLPHPFGRHGRQIGNNNKKTSLPCTTHHILSFARSVLKWASLFNTVFFKQDGNAVIEQIRSVLKVHFRASHEVSWGFPVEMFTIKWPYAVKGLIVFSLKKLKRNLCVFYWID